MVRTLVTGSGVIAIVLFSTAGTTACAHDGCETVKGKYRVNLTLSSGAGCTRGLEGIIDTEAPSDANGCGQTVKKTQGTSTCKVETTATCPNGNSSIDVLNCEDDGEKCSGTVSFNSADGSACIYDYTATRL